jgi:hypothetical protein
LYATRVKLYGKDLTREACVAAKRAADMYDAGFISRVMPLAPGETRIAVALHDNFEDRIVNQGWIGVDPKTGEVSVDDARVPIDAAREAAVVRACK